MEIGLKDNLGLIKSEIRKKTGINIENFKPTFLERRILYRMRSIGIKNFNEYAKILSNDPKEAHVLYRAFSINVTKFFRDPHVWDKISADILDKLISKSRLSSIQAWSCGCASGEEPYSISIMLAEFLKDRGLSYSVYGTDISQDALNHAQKGVYHAENLVNVKDPIKNQYFEKPSEKEFQVKQKIKRAVEFQKLDMLKAWGKTFDMIFCRNVLIYYDRESHELIFKKFYDSLKKNGFLILGQDESMIGTNGNTIFKLINPKERIYQKISE